MITTSAPAENLRAGAMAEGMLTLRQSGLEKVREGLTTLEEVVRETM
jgi:type IV pilus assembly protein PilB